MSAVIIDEFALLALGERVLGNALFGQGIVKVGDSEGSDVVNQCHVCIMSK